MIEQSKNYDFQSKIYLESFDIPLENIYELRQKVNGGSTLHMELNLLNSNLTYQTAHNLGVFPQNNFERVKKLADYLEVNLEKIFTFKVPENCKDKIPFPSPISVKNALTLFCDFEGIIMFL